jgi:hypothetical protein
LVQAFLDAQKQSFFAAIRRALLNVANKGCGGQTGSPLIGQQMKTQSLFCTSLWLLLVLASGPAQARPGISARFAPMQAVESEALSVRIEVSDPLNVIQRVQVFVSVLGQAEESSYSAHSTPKSGPSQIWSATVPANRLPAALSTIYLRAHLMTKRGGLILTLGAPERFDLQVLSAARARKEKAVFKRLGNELQGDFPFVGGLGLELKAGSSARARALVSGSAKSGQRWEMGLKVSVGPNFLEPSVLNQSGPLVIGFEFSGRRRIPSRPLLGVDVFAEIYANLDLRLPGIDPHAGIRFGLSHAFAGEARVDLAFGGGPTWFDAANDQNFWGFSGGLQSILWFGDNSKNVAIR